MAMSTNSDLWPPPATVTYPYDSRPTREVLTTPRSHHPYSADRDSGINSPTATNGNVDLDMRTHGTVSCDLTPASPVIQMRNKHLYDTRVCAAEDLPTELSELRSLRERLRGQREELLRGEEQARLTLDILRLRLCPCLHRHRLL